jgi:hypothetical protein
MRRTNNLSDLTLCCGQTGGGRSSSGGISFCGMGRLWPEYVRGWQPGSQVFGRVLLLALCACSSAMAVTSVPLEFNPNATMYNLQSQRGVPISSVSNSVTGSDGRLPIGQNESGSLNPATTNQFASLSSFGGGLGLSRANWLAVSNSATLKAGATAFCSAVVDAMKLPVGRENGDLSPIAVVQRQARVGAPYLCRQSNTLFGGVIPVPDTDEFDLSITNMAPSSYWLPQPSTNGDASISYYWSPNAGAVYATQPGPITITWIKAAPYTGANLPAYTNLDGTCSFFTNGSSVYLLHTARYIVSSSAVKTPRKMYWTEGTFAFLGKPVSIEKARVPGGVRIVYNSGFPESVTTPYTAPGEESDTNTFSNPLTRLKTFYYDTLDSYLHANNLEGRVFMELLGDAKEDGSRQSLGIEIVDVTRQPVPVDVTTELGERLLPLSDKTLDEVTPEPLLQSTGVSFIYRKSVVGSAQTELYATRVTANVNDCLVHWMESGLQGLKWPAHFARYALVWPDDGARYSHYVRSAVATEAEAMQTAIALPTVNVPVIAYQDPCDRPRAKLTPEFKFYTFLDTSVPAHRTLLQFTSGDNVAFERVFSWLDTNLRTTNFTGTVAEETSQFTDYRAACAAYSNSLPAYADYLVKNIAYTNYQANLAGYLAAYAVYTNYVASNAVYQTRWTAYTNYLAASVAYPNQLASYRTYTNDLAQYLSKYAVYTNYQASYAAYTNFVSYTNAEANYQTYTTNRTRGVNGTWKLFANDDAPGDWGVIGGWSMIVWQRDGAGNLRSNVFASVISDGTVLDMGKTTPYPLITVISGVTNYVESIGVKLVLGHWKPRDFDILLSGPRNNVTYILSDVGYIGGDADYWSHVPLTFSDWTTNGMVWDDRAIQDGTWLPTNKDNTETVPSGFGLTGPIVTNLNALLQSPAPGISPPYAVYPGVSPVNPGSAPPVVVNPGSAPTPVANPGSAPTIVANPGSAPTLVANPGDAPVQLPVPVFGGVDLPRVIGQVVYVGDRICAPDGELGQDGSWAGHLNMAMGNLYNPGTYIDPLTSGFAAANQGAIIPVNAVPGTNRLEVWWFRANSAGAGHNSGQTQLGFTPIYWPSVLGCYTIAWPTAPAEIVLASNLGSGTLDPLVAQGTIYHQNTKALPGYNPNEEHALMAGGTAYALRDDLNVTNGTAYSSHPFVLINYTDAQSRPAMKAYRVLREKPEDGHVFDYIKTAGQLLQPPMPLAVMARPIEGSGDSAFSRNVEVLRPTGDLPGAWSGARDAAGVYSNYSRFTWQDRKQETWVYRGQHAGLPALQAGRYVQALNRFIALTNTAVMGQPFSNVVHVSRQPETLTLSLVGAPNSGWLKTSGLSVYGSPNIGDLGTNVIQLIVTDSFDGQRVTATLVLRVAGTGTVDAQAPLAISSTNPYTQTVTMFRGRAPLLAFSPTPTNSFTMRYYYKTEAGFDWPGQAVPVGTVVPYLRPLSNNAYVGDGASAECAALDIVYRPVWPETGVPTLPFAQTLADPVSGLPGVRDWKSAQILYQQSVATNITNACFSAVLFDPTREKVADLKASKLEKLPAGVASTYYQGKTYFPNLPPHLAARLFFDPNRGDKGSLVLQGEFKKEIMGDSYFLLNVLRGSDLGYATALCPSNDVNFADWNVLINALAATVETHYENPAVPGTYIPDPRLTVSVGVTNIVEVGSANTMVDSYALSASGPGSGFITLAENSGTANTLPGDPVALHIIRVGGTLYTGELKILPAPNPLSEQVTFQHTADLAGRFSEYEYEWKIGSPVDGMPPVSDDTMSRYQALTTGLNLPRYILGGAGVQALGDNYVTLRYRPNNVNHPLYNQWSDWTSPALAEGWIKRVLAGINPFAQRTSDLFNNAVNTDVSLLTQAGHRWEGDVALNADTLNNYGLIEIYETVLRRGRMLSIESGYNYGPANDALLLAAGYLNDLYMMVGNEAWADAANPTIGIGTKDATYGDVATALFAFKGQEPSLLEEELALLRGRDDVLQPGVSVSPVYNRLVWNYTRGIDAGEVIYALNYNITENPDETADGIVNAADAAVMFPQGHGDAYGHYLTALKGYYSLISNRYFDWVPRIEAVSILGKAVSVDYQDERKFAAAAVALARAGQQTLALTLRRDFLSVASVGWAHLSATKTNSQTQRTRCWGADHWAARTGQGAYLNWVVGNAMLPDVDPNPQHEGIQKVDRTTVPELAELTTLAADVQTALDNAEGGLNPLGMPEGALALDIDPNVVVGTDNGTHFEQIYGRAKVALNNAVVSFDDAKDITRMMRAEQDSLADFKSQVANQELSYNNALVELYGTPYPDDIGAGKTFSQGYTGPDLMHYAYVDQPEYKHPSLVNKQTVFKVDTQLFPDDGTWTTTDWSADGNDFDLVNDNSFVEFNIGPNGFISKPEEWTGTRASPGKIQQGISGYSAAYNRLQQALLDAEGAKSTLNYSISMFEADVKSHDYIAGLKSDQAAGDQAVASAAYAMQMVGLLLDHTKESITKIESVTQEAIPQSLIAGLAFGGDVASAARSALKASGFVGKEICDWQKIINTGVIGSLTFANDTAKRWLEIDKIAPTEWEKELRGRKTELANLLGEVQGQLVNINRCARDLDDAQQSVRASVAAGDRIQLERQTFRRRAAVVVQGYRTRDAGFRIFRSEKLERYKTLFDLSARYAFLAANAYDYETGLLNTSAGRSFINRIVSARALGVVKNGEPQYAGSNTGDPGLSSALAEMKADWDVLRGRLGFNNPDAYGTIASLRTEGLRILPGSGGDANWKDVLQNARMDNILDDADVRRNCMQIDNGSGLAVPGIVMTFSTTITDGLNLFGQELAGGDHAFSPSSFATKLFAVGVALEGYRGMDDPAANSGTGGTSPSDPNMWYLDPLALSATPYVYLIPVGMDAMRSPPLGDAGTIRTWTVSDVAIPMPFNIGASDFSTKSLWQSSDSLTEPLFAVRKHQAFRPVSTTSVFSPSLYGANGTLLRTQYTNNRLVGRSVWNTQWKLVIPGKTLLNDPKAGLDRFIQTVKDAKLYFVTYSYSGN